jgi:hypothetical protein
MVIVAVVTTVFSLVLHCSNYIIAVSFCMKSVMLWATGNVPYVWTSGHKCNFAGCDRSDLKPVNVYGWFWTGTLQKMPPTTNRIDTDWSNYGG